MHFFEVIWTFHDIVFSYNFSKHLRNLFGIIVIITVLKSICAIYSIIIVMILQNNCAVYYVIIIYAVKLLVQFAV